MNQPETIPKNIARRIARHVYAANRRFFAVAHPGFEKTSAEEISRIIENAGSMDILEGGIEFSGKIEDMWKLHLASHTITRILLRIDSFRAIYFERFRERLSRIPWELYLSPLCGAAFSISCRSSRLYHTGRLEEESVKAVAEAMRRFYPDWDPGDPAEKKNQTVFLRFEDDMCSVSLDCSGDPLYMRGFRTFVEEAPLRETLAASILLEAGIDSCDTVLDPMCGSGVFAVEAALMAKGILPGSKRSFSFQDWPGHKAAKYGYIRKTMVQEYAGRARNIEIAASDIEASALETARKNILNCGLGEAVSVEEKDFFSISSDPYKNRKCLIVLNPPYGKRISQDNLSGFFRKIIEFLNGEMKDSAYGMIVPREILNKIPAALFAGSRAFSNGGLKLSLVVRKK